MPRIKVLDAKGNEMPLLYKDGCFLPPTFPFNSDAHQHIKDVQNLTIREDDILMWDYAKCGTHWLWEMIQMLFKGQVQYEKGTKEGNTVDYMTPAMMEALPSPRAINCHFRSCHVPQQVFEKKNKIIVLHRDPKDVAVSWYNHMLRLEDFYAGKFSEYVELFLEGTVTYGSWFDFERGMQEFLKLHPDLPVLHVYYEDMKQDCPKELCKVARFLGITVSEELIQSVADACQFNKMQAVVNGKESPMKAMWKGGKSNMCRKGIVGDWKNWFSPENKERLDRVFAEKLSGTELADRYLK